MNNFDEAQQLYEDILTRWAAGGREKGALRGGQAARVCWPEGAGVQALQESPAGIFVRWG
jgi:hypothetical protein